MNYNLKTIYTKGCYNSSGNVTIMCVYKAISVDKRFVIEFWLDSSEVNGRLAAYSNV